MEKRTIDSNKLHELRISRFALKLLFVADRLHNPYAEVLNRKLLMIIGQWYLHNLQPMHAEVLNRTTHRTIHAHIATRPAAEPFTCHKVIPIGAALNYHKSGSHARVAVCDWDQNGTKRSVFLSRADKGIKTKHQPISTLSQLLRRYGNAFVL